MIDLRLFLLSLYPVTAINFFLSAALTLSHRFWYVVLLFSFSLTCYLIFLRFFLLVVYYLEMSCLSLQFFGEFHVMLLLISSLFPFWLAHAFYITSSLSSLSRFILLPRMWAVLDVGFPWILENVVYSAVVWSVL